ncbi:MAG: class I SAM-dependent methyltransferase [Anaerolineae bacterium]|nr:class I SAM-dependent methyltransferase [Anaerolineae bacterium]
MPKSIAYFDARAERYHRRGGFAPERKEKALQVTRDLLLALTPPGSTLLQLGAGTGFFTEKLLQASHFREIHVTDGAQAMLAIAQQTLASEDTILRFSLLDFATLWSGRFAGIGIDAVASSMAIHHAENKQQLFRQVLAALKPGGVLVFADHVAGTSDCIQHLIGRERALVRLGRDRNVATEKILQVIRTDEKVQREEGNRCESVARNQDHLARNGSQDVDCLWRDYWPAVFVARKPACERDPASTVPWVPNVRTGR